MELEQTPVSFDEKSEEPKESNEMDLLLNRLLRKDISKCSKTNALMMKLKLEQLACELICYACGGYEHSENLVHCIKCRETFHFFC